MVKSNYQIFGWAMKGSRAGPKTLSKRGCHIRDSNPRPTDQACAFKRSKFQIKRTQNINDLIEYFYIYLYISVYGTWVTRCQRGRLSFSRPWFDSRSPRWTRSWREVLKAKSQKEMIYLFVCNYKIFEINVIPLIEVIRKVKGNN